MSSPIISFWVDHSPDHFFSKQDKLLNIFSQCNISRLSVMVNAQEDKTFSFSRWSEKDIYRLELLIRPKKIGLVICCWIRPSKAYIDGILDILPPLACEWGAGIEFDAEENWEGTKVETNGNGYPNHTLAGKDLHDGLALYRDIWSETGGKVNEAYMGGVGVTVHTGRISPSITSLAQVVAVQCYSNSDRGDSYQWGQPYGPGNLQKLGIKKVKELDKGQTLDWKRHTPQCILGLPAWAQEFDNHTPQEAMEVEFQVAIDNNIKEVRYWSSTWLENRKYVRDFLTLLGTR